MSETITETQPVHVYTDQQRRDIHDIANTRRYRRHHAEAVRLGIAMGFGTASPGDIDGFIDLVKGSDGDESDGVNCLNGCCYIECCCGEENRKCCAICGASWTCPCWFPLAVAAVVTAAAVFFGTGCCVCGCCGLCGGKLKPKNIVNAVGEAINHCGYCCSYCCLEPGTTYADFEEAINKWC